MAQFNEMVKGSGDQGQEFWVSTFFTYLSKSPNLSNP